MQCFLHSNAVVTVLGSNILAFMVAYFLQEKFLPKDYPERDFLFLILLME